MNRAVALEHLPTVGVERERAEPYEHVDDLSLEFSWIFPATLSQTRGILRRVTR
jgi:hypothetical protein